MKTCRKCNGEKVNSEFHRSRQKRDGLQSWCKECMNTYQRGMHPARSSAEAPAAPEEAQPATKPPRRLHAFAYDLGEGRVVRFLDVPDDLTRKEAGKIKRLIWAYVEPEDLPAGQSDRPWEGSGSVID